MMVATSLFALFTILAILVGVVDLMRPISPWGYRLPIFGQMALVVSTLSLGATYLLWKLKKLGVYVGIVSFAFSFIVNVYVGEHLILHVVAGILAGLVLFFPLALEWKSLS